MIQFWKKRDRLEISSYYFLSACHMPPINLPLFQPSSFSCHPILDKGISVGGIFLSRTALPGGVNRAGGLAKATRPLTCTHFDPWPIAPSSPAILGCPVLPASDVKGCFAKSPQTGAKECRRSVLSTFPQTRAQIATRTTTGGNRAFRLPRPNSPTP